MTPTFPKHTALSIMHNENKLRYHTVAEEVQFSPEYFADENWVSKEDKQQAIDTNDLWTMHLYPNTPVRFEVLHAATLDNLLKVLAEQA